MLDQLPPNNEKVEIELISACLTFTESLYEVVEIVEPDDFYFEKWQVAYKAILSLHHQKLVPAPVSVKHELIKLNWFETYNVSEDDYFAWAFKSLTPAETEYHIKELLDLSHRRQIQRACYQALMAANDVQKPLEDIVSDLNTKLNTDRLNPQKIQPLSEILQKIEDRIIEIQTTGKEPGLKTGIRELDRALGGGFYPTDYVILAARPSIGKSALALQVAAYVANSGKTVAYFSGEMAEDELLTRVMAGQAGIRHDNLKMATMSDQDWVCFKAAAEKIRESWKLSFVNMAGMTPRGVTTNVRKIKHMHDSLDLIIIDYIGLMEPNEKRKNDNTTADVTAISKALKKLTMQLGVPVLCLCQLSRGLEGRTDKKPKLHDLRDSGALEQDANTVIFIHRANPGEEQAMLMVAKQRNGPVGDEIHCTYDGDFVRFNVKNGGRYGSNNYSNQAMAQGKASTGS